MKKTVKFLGGIYLPKQRDAIECVFDFSITDSNLIGMPEEKSSIEYVTIKASITGTLHVMWAYHDAFLDVMKVLYEFSKRHISEKIREGTILQKEELWLSTSSQPQASPFESSKINMKTGDSFEIEILGTPIMENLSYMQLATNIIETRDYINGVAKEKLGGKILSLLSERDLLQLFREAKTEEEFVYRMSALKNIAINMNEELLNNSVQTDKTGSINLLEAYLKQSPDYDDTSIKVLRSINRLRQAYPIHTDTADGVQDAHRFFGLAYPIKNYDKSWQTILVSYSDALKRIFEMLNAIPKK
ncbi:MAG: hypothetical protein Q8L88_07165 [Bacteroidota bacterium]|nr:hypothetical protein [Bacteroidota bacterium]